MDTALALHRFQFAFTVTYHYLFPQLTMGLALLIVVLKTFGLRTGDKRYDQAARFWAKIFAVNFAMGVVTGIPMEFQFGTNWSRFSKAAGGVIGQTLAIEGVYSFFLESTFLGLFLYGEGRLNRFWHWFASVGVCAGAWLSGFFIVCTDAWMQHPTGYELGPNGEILLKSFWGLILNPWAWWMYAHNMTGSVLTAAFVMASIGAYYLLSKREADFAKLFLKTGLFAAAFAAVMMFATGDMQGQMIVKNQPATLAAMEGLFETSQGAPLAILGQPDTEQRKLDNPLLVPNVLSFLTYRRWSAEVKGLDSFPREQWPDSIPLLYYAFHIMVGLGTIFTALIVLSLLAYWRGKLFEWKWLLWAWMLSAPLPYIANTAGWMAAELGRQPWIIYGLMRTDQSHSPFVSAGNTMFTIIGFLGMYGVLSILFLFLVGREITLGPSHIEEHRPLVDPGLSPAHGD